MKLAQNIAPLFYLLITCSHLLWESKFHVTSKGIMLDQNVRINSYNKIMI